MPWMVQLHTTQKVNGVELLSSKRTINSSPGEIKLRAIPDTESRGLLDNDDLDNSGTMTYVSIRHGRHWSWNGLNGLTLVMDRKLL